MSIPRSAHEVPARLAYSISEACQATTLGRSKFLELVYAGQIRSVVVGRRRIIPADALKAFVSGCSLTSDAKAAGANPAASSAGRGLGGESDGDTA